MFIRFDLMNRETQQMFVRVKDVERVDPADKSLHLMQNSVERVRKMLRSVEMSDSIYNSVHLVLKRGKDVKRGLRSVEMSDFTNISNTVLTAWQKRG